MLSEQTKYELVRSFYRKNCRFALERGAHSEYIPYWREKSLREWIDHFEKYLMHDRRKIFRRSIFCQGGRIRTNLVK